MNIRKLLNKISLPKVWYKGGFTECNIDKNGDIWVGEKYVGHALPDDLKGNKGEISLIRGGLIRL